MTAIYARVTVGSDGNIVVPVGVNEAGREVSVTIEPSSIQPPARDSTRDEWHEFVHRTAGAWEGDVSDPPDFPIQDRESF